MVILQLQEGADGFCNVEGSIDSNNAGFSGTGFANTTNIVGASIEWQVAADVAGVVDVTLRFANGSLGGRDGVFSINGVNEPADTVLANTGTWEDWAEQTAMFNLVEGENTIVLSAITDAGLANVDYIEITGLGLSAVHCDGTVPSPKWAEVSRNMADSVMYRHPSVYGGWDYQTSTVLRGFELMYLATNDSRYLNYIDSTVKSVISAVGVISGYSEPDYNLDEIKEGSQLLFLYEQTGYEPYLTAAGHIKTQIDNQPRTASGGFWHKQKYSNQMWLDGIYMAEPFYAHWSNLYGETANYADIEKQFTLVHSNTLDATTGLLYHAWDESGSAGWADATTNHSPVFWSRSMGWYMMALVDVLDYIPATETAMRNNLIGILVNLAAALESKQGDSGLWWQVTNHVDSSDNWQESSGTAMFVYALAKGVRLGYLDSHFSSVAQKGWAGLNTLFVTSDAGYLSLGGTCEGTSVSGDVSYYYGRKALTNDSKGIGPFLMAGVEIEFLQVDSPE